MRELIVACVLLLAGLQSGVIWAEVLRVGMGTHKPPYIYEGQLRGLEHDLIKAAFELAGFQMELYYGPMERLHVLLARGELDAIATTSPVSGIPAFYSVPYVEYQNVAITLARREIELGSIDELGNYSVSAFQRARFLLGEEFQAMTVSNPRYREEARQVIRNLLLYAGRVDVVIADLRIFQAFNHEIGDQVDTRQPIRVHRLFPPSPYSVGFTDPDKRDRFNLGLQRLRESGRYQRIEARYADF